MKDDKERNKLIKEVYSNEKQVKLDKCIIKKCNKKSLEYIKELIKISNLKIPKEKQFPNIKKITEDDIPDIIIKFKQFYNL
jgi:hypothetical protein